MANQQIANDIADEIVEWLDATATAVADALLGGPFTPDVEEPSQADRLDYFRTLMFNPDGTPNLEGRDTMLRDYGPAAYETAALALAKEG